MITIRDKSKFWEFLYGMEKTIKLPEENGPHHSIARIIVDSYDFEEFSNKIRKKSKQNLDFKLITINKGTLEKDIKSGEISIATLTSILCYFFFKISILAEEKENLIIEIEKLKALFKLLGNSSIKAKERTYINLVLNFNKEKFNLNEVELTINDSFELISNYNSLKNELQNQHVVNEFSDAVLTFNSIDKIEDYRLMLKEEFKEIRVGFANFSIPIEQVIELPFYRKDEEIEIKIEILKTEIKSLKENNDIENIAILSKRVNELEELLNEPNSANEILNRGEDIFILSPAGSGKTTTLKSFAYSLASDQNRLPIFIELQSYKSDLNSLINEELKLYGLDIDSISKLYNGTIVLLMDGFDEYSAGSEVILIKEIRNFKKASGCQIVFTGRFKPINIDSIKFYFYQLSEFSDENINSLFRNVFPNNGQKYFDILLKEDLLRYVVTPLFLFFLITYLKQNDEEIELNSIRELLENKAKLLEKVLINDFIYNYEQKKKINILKTQWIKIKSLQIQIISLFAYYLTFELRSLENTNYKDEKIIEYLISKIKHPFDIEESFYTDLFEDFRKHSILTIKGGNIGFDKKEVRLFFASYYLATQIKNIDDFTKFKNHFKGDTDSWESIEKYVFGLIEPSTFMVNLDAFLVKDQIIYNDLFFQQLEYAQKFIYAGKLSKKFKLLDKFYFLNIIVMILFNHLKYGMNYSIEGFSMIKYQPYFLFRKLKKPYIEYFHFLIPKSNYYYHCYHSGKDVTIFHHLYELKKILELPKSKIVFKEINVNESNFNRLNCSLNDSIISFSKIENSPNLIFLFVDYLIFDPNFKIKKDSKVDLNYISDLKNLEHFLNQFFKLNAHSYLDYFFSTHNPTPLKLRKLYGYFEKNSTRIDSHKILAITKTTIINHFDLLAHYNTTKDTYKFTQLVSDAMHYILDSKIKNELLDKWKSEITNENTDQKTKERLFIIYANHLPDKDISFLMSFLDDKDIEFQNNAIWGLTKYISSYPKKDEEIVNQVNEKLHNLFKESEVNLKLKIIRFFKIFRTYPNQGFLNDIIDFAKQDKDNEINFIEYFGSASIKESTSFLENTLQNEKLSFITFDALVKIDTENFFKYNTPFIKRLRKFLNSQLESHKRMICYHKLSVLDINDFKISLLIGDETTLKILEEINEIIYGVDKSILSSKNRDFISDTYYKLQSKVIDLQSTEYYKKIHK